MTVGARAIPMGASDITASMISFGVDTWGNGKRHVPSVPPLSPGEFSHNYHGYVAAKD